MTLSPRKIREREARKQEILDAARQIFFDKGFHATTMEAIGQRAGFSKGAIYFYFKSKEEILVNINCTVLEAFLENLKRIREQNTVLEEVVRILVNNLRTMFKIHLVIIDDPVYFTAGPQPLNVPEELSERWYQVMVQILRVIQDLLDHAPAKATRSQPDSFQYALFILAMGLGVFQLSKVRNEALKKTIAMETQIDIFEEVVLKGLIRE